MANPVYSDRACWSFWIIDFKCYNGWLDAAYAYPGYIYGDYANAYQGFDPYAYGYMGYDYMNPTATSQHPTANGYGKCMIPALQSTTFA